MGHFNNFFTSSNSLIFTPIKLAGGVAKYINYQVRVPQTKKGCKTLGGNSQNFLGKFIGFFVNPHPGIPE